APPFPARGSRLKLRAAQAEKSSNLAPIMALTRGGRLGVVLLVPALAFCHRVAPPKAPPPPPAATPIATSFPQREAGALIPRKIVLGARDRSDVQISPDGKSIGWLAPVDGFL